MEGAGIKKPNPHRGTPKGDRYRHVIHATLSGCGRSDSGTLQTAPPFLETLAPPTTWSRIRSLRCARAATLSACTILEYMPFGVDAVLGNVQYAQAPGP